MNRSALYNLRRGFSKPDPTTKTEKDQSRTELLVRKAYNEKLETWGESSLRLFKLEHINYLTKRLVDLPTSFDHLDASQPWLAYWMVHGLRLLCYDISATQKKDIIHLLRSCQHPEGGFSGGPYQLAHLAPTYGAVNCLACLQSSTALDLIDRRKLTDWIAKLRQPDGSFIMHHGGEIDVRGAYCAIAVAHLTGLLQFKPDLFLGTAEWISRCQTYEGGFGGQPGLEAHGGYSFCAFAALHLLQRIDLISIPPFLRWIAHRQLPTEGGFQGRTHKLVDSCYSFWMGAAFPLVEDFLLSNGDQAYSEDSALFDTSAIQEYILLCCQKVFYMQPGLSVPRHLLEDANSGSSDGGLIDKPGKNVDPYHTCYALSGLSVAQHAPRLSSIGQRQEGRFAPARGQDVVGVDWGNELADLDPRFNVVVDAVAFTRTYFQLIDAGRECQEAEGEATLAAQKVSFKPCITTSNSFANMATNDSNDCLHGENGGDYLQCPVNDDDDGDDESENGLPQICNSP